jgi:hypothetical protein
MCYCSSVKSRIYYNLVPLISLNVPYYWCVIVVQLKVEFTRTLYLFLFIHSFLMGLLSVCHLNVILPLLILFKLYQINKNGGLRVYIYFYIIHFVIWGLWDFKLVYHAHVAQMFILNKFLWCYIAELTFI